jgi:hypothetical protein
MLPIFILASAQISINPNIPGMQNISTTGPCGWIVNFYVFALIIAGILAFGAIVYGGIKYSLSVGNPPSQSEGRSWIWGALLGLLLLACAWLILYTINPNLTKCTLPQLSKVNLASGGGTGGGGGGGSSSSGGSGSGGGGNQQTALTQAEAQTDLTAAGIGVASTGNCSDPSNPNCTSLAGMQESTVDNLVDFKNECGTSCTVTVTGGTEAGHAAGDASHANGDKADIALNPAVNNYITQNFVFVGNRSSDGSRVCERI